MRADDFFAAARDLPMVELCDLVSGGLVVVAPHPDDESLGCGGLIAAAVDAGRPVRLLVVSDGTGSHPNSKRYPRDALRRLRETEALAAAHALGLSESCVGFLRLRDTAVPVTGPDADHACAAILGAIDECRARTICVTWPFDPHCDHVASAHLVDKAVAGRPDLRVLHYPVWGWTLSPETEVPGPPCGVRFGVEKLLPRKAAAIAAHRSQLTNLIHDDPNGFRLQADMLERFAGPFETYLFASDRLA
jgi:LmbE family N-acetylglucosaminyl deacetylase